MAPSELLSSPPAVNNEEPPERAVNRSAPVAPTIWTHHPLSGLVASLYASVSLELASPSHCAQPPTDQADPLRSWLSPNVNRSAASAIWKPTAKDPGPKGPSTWYVGVPAA